MIECSQTLGLTKVERVFLPFKSSRVEIQVDEPDAEDVSQLWASLAAFSEDLSIDPSYSKLLVTAASQYWIPSFGLHWTVQNTH